MEGQNGFRADRSTEDNIFILYAKLVTALAKKRGKLYLAFINFRRAFDSVSRTILWQKLYACGLSAQLIKVLQCFYNNATVRVKVGGGEFTDEVRATKGVLQGDSLSPILFCLFLFDLEKFFLGRGHHKVGQDLELLLYADDMTITANNVIDMQDKLDTLYDYCRINELEVNTDKSKIMIAQKSGRKKKIKSSSTATVK